MFTYELKCRFCQKITGELKFQYSLPSDIDKQFLDTRCDECEVKNGSIKEMEELHRLNKVKEPFEDFIKKTNFKKSNFEKKITDYKKTLKMI